MTLLHKVHDDGFMHEGPKSTKVPLAIGMHPHNENLQYVLEHHDGNILVLTPTLTEVADIVIPAGRSDDTRFIRTKGPEGTPDAFFFPWERAMEAIRAYDATQIHVFGGLHTANPLNFGRLDYLILQLQNHRYDPKLITQAIYPTNPTKPN